MEESPDVRMMDCARRILELMTLDSAKQSLDHHETKHSRTRHQKVSCDDPSNGVHDKFCAPNATFRTASTETKNLSSRYYHRSDHPFDNTSEDEESSSSSIAFLSMLIGDMCSFMTSFSSSYSLPPSKTRGTNDTTSFMIQFSQQAMELLGLGFELISNARIRGEIGCRSTAEESIHTSNSTTISSNPMLSVEQFHEMIVNGIWNIYRSPSVVNGFPKETIGFYDWWRSKILVWIALDESDMLSTDHLQEDFRVLGWKHLQLMIRETQTYLIPPPKSYQVAGAGSQCVNGIYELSSECMLSSSRYKYYCRQSPRYEKKKPKGNPQMDPTSSNRNVLVNYDDDDDDDDDDDEPTMSLCKCETSNGCNTKNTWFLTQLDEEQPNTDSDIDYYCAPNSIGDRLPPCSDNCIQHRTSVWKTCSSAFGLFPPPKLRIVSGSSTFFGPEKPFHHALAEWIIANNVVEIGLLSSSTATTTTTHAQVRVVLEESIPSCIDFLLSFYEDDEGSIGSDQWHLSRSSSSFSLWSEFLIQLSAWGIQRFAQGNKRKIAR